MRDKKFDKIRREQQYAYQEKAMLFSMFDYKNIPFRKEFIEWELLTFGFGGIAKDGDTIYAGSVFNWEYDAYGLPKEGGTVEFITRHGHQFKCTLGKDCVIGYNNAIRTPELGLEYYAKILTEIDTSIDALVKKSRVNPMPVARNQQEKNAIKAAMDSTEKGNTDVILQENLLSQLTETEKGIPIVSLTFPEEIERVQYLSKLHDDILRRGLTFYGHTLQSASKMAQVNEKELEGYDTYSMIYPMQMLAERKEMIDKCNEIFGTDFSVDFSKPWKHLTEEDNNMEEIEEVEEGENNETE